MRSKFLYIVDIRFKQKNIDLSSYIKIGDYTILSLTPYSSFLLDKIEKNHMTYHDIISIEEFHENVLEKYNQYEIIFQKYKEFSFLFRDYAFLITFEEYISQLITYLKLIKKENVKVYYITDTIDIRCNTNVNFLFGNYISKYIDEKIMISSKDKVFYANKKVVNLINRLMHQNNVLQKFIDKYVKNNLSLPYDMKNFSIFFNSLCEFNIKAQSCKHLIMDLNDINNSIIYKKKSCFKTQYLDVATNLINILKSNKSTLVKVKPFSFLSKISDYAQVLINKENNIPNIFIQHGSYLEENIFLKYNEIFPADVSLVFNDYTKKLFEKRGVKKVYSVGSIDFNYPIAERPYKYDYVYILYCTSYNYSGLQIFSKYNKISLDGVNIYERHISIIKLFGTKLKDKKICIKIQAGIFTGTMMYVPFLELSKSYKNITIEFITPLQELFQCSQYIISDYFSSEFINIELHYKRDIILFKGALLLLPKETIEDMNKMFILVDTVEDFEEKVKNIEEITKNRKRYDDIIEYYSSKKCDTKKVVTEILEKELNGK
ncbi:MAG: hypothetical protein L3I99_06415 [Sulfurimonas sp.]|nr:hypothetical protein [Sulfurimonas sp.]